MAAFLISGLLNMETVCRVRGFPINYYPVDYPFFGVATAASGVALNIAKALTVLENRVILCSLLADDVPGRVIIDELKSSGIDTENISMSGLNVRRVYPLFEDNLMALGTLDGQVRIFDPAAENWPAVLPFGSRSAVTGLWHDAEENVLYGCNSAGAVRSWDLGLFRDMTCILPLLRLPGINRIDEFVKKYPEPGVKAAADWLKTVVLWRRRFDIEIEF